MGKILLVVSDKGGVGKSTYVANTASMLVNRSKSVIILKTDKNNDLLSWNEKRQGMVFPSLRCTRHTVT